MQETLSQGPTGRLERSCKRARITAGTGAAGIERMAARFEGQAFAPHRHDTYAIGITLSGVRTFTYRGAKRQCLPGQCLILHPDEMHDGGAGNDDGFGYRIIYLDPALIQQALDGRPLPFVADPVIRAFMIPAAVRCAILDMDDPIDDVARNDITIAFGDMLTRLASDGNAQTKLELAALERVHDCIAAEPQKTHAMDRLESIANLDRWTLARQFRAAYGTSPGRFRTMRRLDLFRRLVMRGTLLAVAAIDSGFADQSHMTRQFKRAYGLTPARWIAAQAA
jgi:AraC-like DNA-binding protein